MGSPPKEGPEYGPLLACTTDGTVYAVWEDKRYGGEWDIFFTRSTNYGVTWGPNIRLDTDNPGAFRSFRPQLACDGKDGVYVAWEDWREGYHHIYMNYSRDRGATWQASDFRVDTDTNAAHAEWPTLRVDRQGTVYVGWGYHRIAWSGDITDFHFNVSLPPDLTPPALPELPAGGDLGINPDPLPSCVDDLTATDDRDGEVPVVCSAGEVTGDDCNKSQVFTYTATDAAGNTATGAVTYTWKDGLIRITSEKHVEDQLIRIQSVDNLIPGETQYLDTTTNLLWQDWTCILTNPTPLPWPVTNLWECTIPADDDLRFFRVRQ